MGIRSKIKYYYTAVVAKLSIFSNLFLRKRIVIKRTPVRGKYVRQLSESFDFHFFFHALACCCQVCQSFIAALRNCCANLICTFFLHIFTKISCQLKQIFLLFQLSGLGSEKYVLKACLSHGKRILPMKDDGYPYRILPDHGSDSRSWDRNRFVDTGN